MSEKDLLTSIVFPFWLAVVRLKMVLVVELNKATTDRVARHLFHCQTAQNLNKLMGDHQPYNILRCLKKTFWHQLCFLFGLLLLGSKWYWLLSSIKQQPIELFVASSFTRGFNHIIFWDVWKWPFDFNCTTSSFLLNLELDFFFAFKLLIWCGISIVYSVRFCGNHSCCFVPSDR